MQRDEAWFAMRAGKMTGSRFDSIMAGTKTAKYRNIIITLASERLTGTCLPTYSNANMERGTELEPLARDAYADRTMQIVDEVDFIQHRDLDYVGVSPDGLVDEDGVIEIKVPAAGYYHKHVEHLLAGQYAKDYRWQIAGLLWVTNRDWCDVVSYCPDYLVPLAVHRVHYDDMLGDIEQLADGCQEAEEDIQKMQYELEAKFNQEKAA